MGAMNLYTLHWRERGRWIKSGMRPFRSIASARQHAAIIGAHKISIRLIRRKRVAS